jgi:hypothetical protein
MQRPEEQGHVNTSNFATILLFRLAVDSPCLLRRVIITRAYTPWS